MSDDDPSFPYVIGYGRPPRHSQFKKGCSGNPSGKKKDKGNLITSFEKMFDSEVTTANGRVITQREVYMRTLIRDAMKCDQKAFARFLRLAKRAGLLKNDAPPVFQGGIIYI